jgi:hypothetical protein
MFTHRRDPALVADEWLAKSRFAIDSGMAYDDRSDADWCQHVSFANLMKDPIGTVHKIYAHYGETPQALHVRRMELWLKERGRHSEGRHVYDPKDFGWSYPGLASGFSEYRERYAVEEE